MIDNAPSINYVSSDNGGDIVNPVLFLGNAQINLIPVGNWTIFSNDEDSWNNKIIAPATKAGAVARCVGIRCDAISGNMRLSFQAARSIG
jgi:hypothetical protein